MRPSTNPLLNSTHKATARSIAVGAALFGAQVLPPASALAQTAQAETSKPTEPATRPGPPKKPAPPAKSAAAPTQPPPTAESATTEPAATESETTEPVDPSTDSAAPEAVPLTDEPTTQTPQQTEEPSAPAETAPGDTAPAAAESVDDGGYSDATLVSPPTPESYPQDSVFMLGVLWDVSIPVASTTDFTSKVSPQGISVDGRYRGFGNLGIGFTVAWHTLSEKTRSTTTYGSATISGTQVRETAATPFTGKIFYALRDMKKVIPYVGFGLGGARVVRRLDMGISRFTDESWHWAMVPEIGVEVPAASFDLLASTRFNYLFKSSDAPEQLYFNLSVGVGFH